MYFSNINNEELKQFHKVIPNNFNMSLTEILKSKLFYVEPIIPNKIYRVFLLFYCEKITPSNSDDVILENKCIICNKTNEETYFNFISDDNDTYILDNWKWDFSLGYILDDTEFNALVQLLRVNNNFSENIKINNSTVKGDYGTYVFNLNSTTIVDNGVLITNETLSSLGTVKLTKPTFKNSRYRLKLIVYSLSNVNVCEESKNDNITKTELYIDLIDNTEVNIPFNTLDLNCVVGFNAVVNIVHDLPVIQYPRRITITCDKLSCTAGDQITLTALYTEAETPLQNEILTFKNNNEVLGTATTNSEGVATFSYVSQKGGELNFAAVNQENKITSTTLDISVVKKPANISLEINKTKLEVGEQLIISGVLKSNNELVTNSAVKIMNGNEELFSTITDNQGKFEEEINTENPFNYNLKAVYDGTTVYKNCESNYTNVICILKNNTEFSITLLKANTISGYLLNQDEVGLANAKIAITYDASSIVETYTDVEGYFTYSIKKSGADYTPRIWNLISYDGDDYNNPTNKNLEGVAVFRTSKIISLGLNYKDGFFNRKGKLVDDLDNPIANATINATMSGWATVSKTATTANDGTFTLISAREEGWDCEYAGDNGIEGCTGYV